MKRTRFYVVVKGGQWHAYGPGGHVIRDWDWEKVERAIAEAERSRGGGRVWPALRSFLGITFVMLGLFSLLLIAEAYR